MIELVLDRRQCFVASLAAGQRDVIGRVIDAGWTKGRGPAENALDEIAAAGGAVLNIYGAFDDPEVAVAAIGRATALDRLRVPAAGG